MDLPHNQFLSKRHPLSIFAPPISGDPLSTAGTPPLDRDIGSVWRRFVAFVVDGIIVGVAGTVIALPFFDTFSHLGPWGRLVGFFLALSYFAILDSNIGNGQTLGKRLMHLQVVDKDGGTISFWRSALRYGLFAVPFYLNGILLPTTRTPWVVSALASLVVFGVGGATLYLVLFNRHTRQGVHDLAVGSYVADADKSGPLKTMPTWKAHWAILGSLLLVLGVGTGILGKKLGKWGPFPELLEDVRLIEELRGVQVAGAQDLNWTNWGNGEKKKILVINVYWTGKSADDESFADQVAKLILEHDSKVRDRDLLRVTIIRGYDIGIAHAQVSHPYEHTPAEWNARLVGSSAEVPPPAKL
jgi:uncharacterized RDD family membrane protein YckC